MTQQDYTAPEIAARISRREAFGQAFQVFRADGLPDTSLAGVGFWVDILDASNQKVTTLACTRPAGHAVQVALSDAQMKALRPVRYRFEVYSVVADKRAGLVTIVAQVVDANGSGGLAAVSLYRRADQPVRVVLERGPVYIGGDGERREEPFTNLLTQTFRHGFGFAPSVTILDTTGQQIGLQVEHLYEVGSNLTNEVRITSNQPVSGKAVFHL